MKIPSTKPKGATSYKETAFGIVPRSELLRLETEGIKKGLEFIFTTIARGAKTEVTPKFILELHAVSFGWIFPDWAGKYRTVRVEFSSKETVLPHQVPELIVNLCADLQERLRYLKIDQADFVEKVVELLAWFQHRFVWIHPFRDYNGRVARMLTTLILLSLSLPPTEIKAESGKDRRKYLEAMCAADEGNYAKLEDLIARAMNESLVKSTK